jgi:hypothetical protein
MPGRNRWRLNARAAVRLVSSALTVVDTMTVVQLGDRFNVQSLGDMQYPMPGEQTLAVSEVKPRTNNSRVRSRRANTILKAFGVILGLLGTIPIYLVRQNAGRIAVTTVLIVLLVALIFRAVTLWMPGRPGHRSPGLPQNGT